VSSKVATTILCALLALNLIVLDLIWPLPLLRVAGLRALQLEKDPDFVPAVRAIVQKCRGTRTWRRSIADPDRVPSWQGEGLMTAAPA
jgi:hypothetical protein